MKAYKYIKENMNTIGIISIIIFSVLPIFFAWQKNFNGSPQTLLKESKELKLNNGKKWESNEYTEKAMTSILRGVSQELQNEELKQKDFKEIKQLLNQIISAIIQNNQLEENAAKELKKLFALVSDELPRLGSGDLTDARNGLVKIDKILKTYYDFFVLVKQ